jgi:urease accessory protein
MSALRSTPIPTDSSPGSNAAALPAAPPGLAARARGAVVVTALAEGGRSRLGRLRQEGSLKLLFPRSAGPALEAVLLNTAGGLTGGDRMRVEAEVAPGARLLLSTQAAERAYRAAGEAPARADVALAAGHGARIDWLPQETILFEGCRLARTLRADLRADATLLAVEPLLLGRLARGERLANVALRDRWEVRREGRLVFADALRLEGDLEARLGRAATLGGARALATVLLVGPGAEAMLPPLRALLPPASGASLVREGVLVARLLAQDGFALRRALLPIITCLAGAPPPRVWTL